ncbi:MAG: GTP-binding protein [Gammaproteobacteria bacterium]|nr:GTP-binding protein [Gammaproteobacteria bacterium]
MKKNSKKSISQIPTNIITGFLGVGKTTVIQHLLAQKPKHERWAVLVNEFGEVGIDGNIFSGSKGDQTNITISQLPGGCMCCTNGLPMQMALNLLLAKSNPHRLLIEPTGLGHPKEVLAVLSNEYYREVLNLQATLTLIDSRKIQDKRYTLNATFNEQLEIAEVVVANKADLYGPADFPALLEYIEDRFGLDKKLLYQVQHGAVDLEWLERPASKENQENHQNKISAEGSLTSVSCIKAPAEGFVSLDNSGEGFFCRGWVFNAQWLFDADKLHSLIHGIEADRLKGVFITPDGTLGFNKADSTVTKMSLQASSESLLDSRVEVISDRPDIFNDIEEGLLKCVVHPAIASAGLNY